MDNNTIIAMSSVIIALAALVATIWQGLITQKHNRLSVKPIGDILANNFEDKIEVILENKGTGPLIMKSFRAIVGNESKSNVIDWMPNLPEGFRWSNFLKDFEGSAFKPFESNILVEFSLDLRDEKRIEIRDNIREALSKICIEFEYTDIYNNKMYFPLHCLSNVFGNDNSRSSMK
ncbi:MAG: hypothetical protein M0Q21_10540 [Ignavibacteriaceae bacterium]|nr:hypothetical protein [Ignavibacteriaceae bacterium]